MSVQQVQNVTIRDILLQRERVIFIEGEITDMLASHVCEQLQYLNNESVEKPITLMISSPGGSVVAGCRILDRIDTMIKAPIIGVADGLVASMASVIFAHCGKRIVMPNADIMLHQASSGAQGNIQDMRISLAWTEKKNRRLLEYLANDTKHTYDEMVAFTSRDYWLDAEEAVKFGIADEIYSNKKTESESSKSKETKLYFAGNN